MRMQRRWMSLLFFMTILVRHRVVSFTPAHASLRTAHPLCNIATTTVSTGNGGPSSFSQRQQRRTVVTATQRLHSVTNGIDWSTFSMAVVETFDGSQIVDPIVVSNVFWTSLQTKLISFVIGQVLATIVFTVLLWLIGSQISNIMTFLSDRISTIWNEQQQKQPKLRIPPELQESRSSQGTTSTPPDFSKLLFCMAIDVIGSSSELIPIIGDITDVVYAPVAAYMLRSIFGSNNVLFLLEFAEEILPFTDILPLATICWVVDTYYRDSDLAKVLQLGNYATVIDTTASTTTTTPIEPNWLRDDRNAEEMETKNNKTRQQ